MNAFIHRPRAYAWQLAAALLASCAAHGGVVPAGSFGPAGQSIVAPLRVPPDCKGQKTTSDYASITETLSTSGGSLCIPAFGGFGGKLKYPGADPSIDVSLTSSTTNYDNMPELGQGTAIFYIQLGLSGGTSFSNYVGAGGGLASKTLVPKQPYTAYGQAVVYGFKYDFGPCYVVAKKNRYGGIIGGLGTLLKGQSIPVKANAVLEIYSGQQTQTKC